MVNRFVGPTLVKATYEELANCVNLGGYQVVKVVATDENGLGLLKPGQKPRQHEFWNDTNRLNVCNLTRWTIVRTQTGDQNPIDENQVANELRPWYAAKKASRWGINPQ